MEREQRVFLAYRAVFEGNNALVRQPKAIKKLVSTHRKSAKTLLQSFGEKQVVDTLKALLERKVFQSELEAKLAFPNLFTISSSQTVQHIASEADAAKSEAEALDDVASLHGDEDDAQEQVLAEQPANLVTAGIQTQTTRNVVQKPSLYPIYIPFKTQHLVLSKAQSLLEECCYEFTTRWLPELLEQRHWDCPEAIELNKWTYVVVKRLGKLPSQAFAGNSDLSLAESLTSINKLRHTAVHRLPTTAKGISEMIRSAKRFAKALRDPLREQQFDELTDELEGKIRALELNKNYLETKLEGDLEDIARQRRELDEKEKEAVATMLREDKDQGSLVGGLLSQSIRQIFGKSEQQEPDVTELEPSSDYENAAIEENEHTGKVDRSHHAQLDLFNREQSVSDRKIELETHNSQSDHQPLVETLHSVQPLPAMSSDGEFQKEVNHDGLPPESRPLCTLNSQPRPDLESEVTGQSPETKFRSTVSDMNVQRQENSEQISCNSGVPLEVKNLLAGILPEEVYTAYAKAVDAELSTYDFRTGGFTQLKEKRLRRICRFVKEQTNLDTPLHQVELDNLIRLRFATFKSEKRQPANTSSQKKKGLEQSSKIPNDTFSMSLDPDTVSSPPEPLPKEVSSRSQSPLKELLEPGLSLSLNGSSSTSPPFSEAPDASEPKTYQLTAMGDSISPAKLGLLWIDEKGRVEGRMVVDGSGISLV